MRNPLSKRIPRELRTNLGQYLVIFLIMIGTIGACSGYTIAGASMSRSCEEAFTKYHIEDGHFVSSEELDEATIREVEDLGVTLDAQFYFTQQFTNDTKLRIYANRENMNLACLMEGELPQASGEIAIDRMYAENNKLSVGDTLTAEDGASYRITGLVALSDYAALFESNNDSMFDASLFGVAVIEANSFASATEEKLSYCYAWEFAEEYANDDEQKVLADAFLKKLSKLVPLQEYVPQYCNQAIQFAREDISKDGVMMTVLCYILIGILAFIFAVTSRNTIVKEANVIGTLRASGYSQAELVAHYLTMPMIVTLISAIVGNILGYTFLKDYCAGLYYGSYSLPTYVTYWNPDALIQTTLIPMAIMCLINFIILRLNLKKPIQKFLRGDLSISRHRKSVPLNVKLPIFRRYQTRVVLQNLPSILIIFVGAIFANIILLFGLALPNILDNYTTSLKDNMLAKYQYMLTLPAGLDLEDEDLDPLVKYELLQAVTTDTEGAEKLTAYTLKTIEGEAPIVEDVTFYGIVEDSAYVDIPHEDDTMYISRAFSDKYHLSVGDTITLKEAYEDTTYTITVGGIYEYMGSVCVFMDFDELNRYFDLDEGMFVGYFSNREITDLDPDYVGTVIDFDTLNKLSRQLTISMGGLMNLVVFIAIGVFLTIVYLLTKMIIERNTHSISVARILGYRGNEVGRLYIFSISAAIILSFLVSIPLVYVILSPLFEAMFATMVAGWMPFDINPEIFIKMALMGIGSYLLVAAFEFWRVSRIRMDIALKTVE